MIFNEETACHQRKCASLHSSHPGFIIPASHACVQPVFEHCLFCRVQGQHLDKRLLVRHKSLVATHCQDGDGSGHTNTHWHTKQPQAYLTTESVRGSIPLRIKQTPQPLGAEPMASSHYLTVFICSIILEGLLCFYRPVCLPTHPPTYPPTHPPTLPSRRLDQAEGVRGSFAKFYSTKIRFHQVSEPAPLKFEETFVIYHSGTVANDTSTGTAQWKLNSSFNPQWNHK